MRSQSNSDLDVEQRNVDEDSAEEFIVEEIVGKRYNNKTKQFEYLLKWEGYPPEQNTWEPYANLMSCRYLIQEYEKKLHNRHLRKINGVLVEKSSDENTKEIEDDVDHNRSTTNKAPIKSLITLDGSVISSDSPEWVNHVKKDSNKRGHVSPNEVAENVKTETESRANEVRCSNTINSSDNTSSLISDSVSAKGELDGVVKTVIENGVVNDDNSSSCSVRISPLAPPKKRIFDPSILIESTSKIIPEVSSSSLVSTSSSNVEINSDLELSSSTIISSSERLTKSTDLESIPPICNKDDDESSDLNNVIYSDNNEPVEIDSEKLLLENGYTSGIFRKRNRRSKSENFNDEPVLLFKLLTPENRIKAKSSHLIRLGSGIYTFDRKNAMNYVNSEPNVTRFGKILVELLQTKKKVLIIPKEDNICSSNIKPSVDLSAIFKRPEKMFASGTIIKKQTAVSLGIYPNVSESSGANLTSSGSRIKPSVQREETSGLLLGTIKPKSYLENDNKLNRQIVKSNLTTTTISSGIDPTTTITTNIGNSNKIDTGNKTIFKRISDSSVNASAITPSSPVERKISKTTTANSSLRKLLGTINPGGRRTDSSTIDVNDVLKHEDATKEISEFEFYNDEYIRMECDFTGEVNVEPFVSPTSDTIILDPLTGVKLIEDEYEIRALSSNNDERSFRAPLRVAPISGEVMTTRIKGLEVVLKAKSLSEHDNCSIQINFEQSEIGYPVLNDDGSPVVLHQVDPNNDKSGAVDMSSLTYTDTTNIMNENLVISNEDGLVYQVENSKPEGDAIFVSPDEEPQTVYLMSDGSKVVRRMRIDGQPIFTLDDVFNNSLVQINVNERTVLPDGSEIIIGLDEAGYAVHVNSPPGTSSDLINDSNAGEAVVVSETLQESESAAATLVANDQQQEVVATLLETLDTPNPDGSRRVVLLMPDGNLMMTEVDEEQFAALELQK